MKFEFPRRDNNDEPKFGTKEYRQKIERENEEEAYRFLDQIKTLGSLSWEDLENPEYAQSLRDIPADLRGSGFFSEAMIKDGGKGDDLYRSADVLMEYLVYGKNEETRKRAWQIMYGWLWEGNYVWRHYPEVYERVMEHDRAKLRGEEVSDEVPAFTEADLHRGGLGILSTEQQPEAETHLSPEEQPETQEENQEKIVWEVDLTTVPVTTAIWVTTKNSYYLFKVINNGPSSERSLQVVGGSDALPSGKTGVIIDRFARVGTRLQFGAGTTSEIQEIKLDPNGFPHNR